MAVGVSRIDPLYFRFLHKSFMRLYNLDCISLFHLRERGEGGWTATITVSARG